MNLKEWRELKKQLKKLPLEQELRVLAAELKKEKDKEIIEEIKAELQAVSSIHERTKEEKKTASIAPTASSRLVEATEQPAPVRETKREDASPLEVAVDREQTRNDTDQQQRSYTPGARQEYKSASYEHLTFRWEEQRRSDEDRLQRSDYTAPEKRAQTEGERIMKAFDPLQQTETYKKKKDRV